MFKLKAVTPTLKTLDIERTIEFYVSTLGFAVDTLWPEDNPQFCVLDHGDVHFGFYVDGENCKTGPTLTGQIHLEVENVMELHGRIKDKVDVLWGPEVYHYGRREFAIKDCNGYKLTFSEPACDPPTCPGDE